MSAEAKFERGATGCVPPCTWLGGWLVKRSAAADRLYHNHVARMPVVPAGSKCRYLSTRADAEGRAVVGMCCPVGWEWWRDGGGMLALLLMMNCEPIVCHYCDGDNPNDVWWCCRSHHLWGAQVGARPTCHIPTDHGWELQLWR